MAERVYKDEEIDEYIGKRRAAEMAATQKELQRSYLAEAQAARKKAQAEGKKMGTEIFGTGKLGRVEEGRAGEIANLIAARQAQAQQTGRTGGVQDIVARRQQALSGYSPAELQAMREQQQKTLATQQQMALRQMRASQAAQGIRGGAAAAQQSMLQKDISRQLAQQERDLALQNIAKKEAALGEYEKSLTGAEATEFGRQQAAQQALEAATQAARAEELKRQTFNIGQLSQEKYGQLASQLGMAGLSAQEAAAAAQQAIGSQQLQSALAQQGGKK